VTTDVISNLYVFLACAGYGLAIVLLQLSRVTGPRDWLLQRIWYLTQKIDTEQWNVGDKGKQELEKIRKWIDHFWLIVPTSRVQAGWRNVHGLEDDHLLELTGDVLEEQLHTARAALAAIPGKAAENLGKRIDDAKTATDARKAALLKEASVFRHNSSDGYYQDLAGLLGKAVWLTLLALAFVVGLALLFDRETFFLLGAAGALISRLTRVLERRPRASDYGAEWSTLILSPAAGALAGWVGVMIVAVLAGDPFNVLGDRFADLWDDATAPLALVIAFIFGFSERLFNRVLSLAETEVGGALPAEKGSS
jgi:hypothetical protein